MPFAELDTVAVARTLSQIARKAYAPPGSFARDRLLFMLVGLLPILASIWGYLAPRVKLVEQELPDQVPERTAA